MLIIGSIATKEEAEEIIFISKVIATGDRARFLANQIKEE